MDPPGFLVSPGGRRFDKFHLIEHTDPHAGFCTLLTNALNGVRRALAPDSSDADTDVLLLSFEDVGLTPGDRYWLHADSTGRLVAWTFLLEGNTTGLASRFTWSDYTELPTPGGSLVLARRKARGGRAIVTEPFPADSLGADVFDDPRPRL